MVFVALVVGVLGGTMGTVLSCASPNMPTGPWVVISMTLLFAVSVAMQWVSGRFQSSQKG
jgi:ABC-type Mn2+/Zn2+ transport system permease subunit